MGKQHKLTPNYVIFRCRKMLARGRSYGLPDTDGTFWSVFKREVMQEHSVVSIWSAHDLHPFSRNERIMYMFNALVWVFFLAVITAGAGEAAQVLITLSLVVPYKLFARYLLECSCIYTGSYNEKMEIEDGDNDPLNNEHSYFQCCAEIAGYFTSFLLNVMSLFLLIGAIVRVVDYHEGQFVRGWVISQCTSILVTEFLFMAFFTYVNMKVFGHEEAFHKKWEPYFKARGLPDPVSLTDVAELARKEYIEEHSAEIFYTNFTDYDMWFYLDRVKGAHNNGIGPASGVYSIQVQAKHEDVRLAAELDPTRGLNQMGSNPLVTQARRTSAAHAPSQAPYTTPPPMSMPNPYAARPEGVSASSALGAPPPPIHGQPAVIAAVQRK